MIAKAKGRYIRVSPIKVRQVINLIRGKDVTTSLTLLTYSNKGCAPMVGKLLHSAISNAKKQGLNENQLYVSSIKADQGPTWRRYRAAAFGRATRILKKTTHLTIELDLITR